MNRCPVHSCMGVCVCVCWWEFAKGCVGACRSACVSIFKKACVRACSVTSKGQQPWVSPCAQNHLTQADASLKHCHTCWPGERPGKSLILAHISIFFFCPHSFKTHPNSTKTRKCRKVDASRLFFSVFIFSPRLSRSAVCEFRQACVILEGSDVAVGNRLGMSSGVCVCVCVYVCVCEKETVPALAMATQPFSLNQPEQLVSGVDAGHIMHTHTHTHTQRQRGRHWANGGPVMCGQRIDVDRPHLLLLCCCCCCRGTHNRWLKHNCLSPYPFLTFFSFSSTLLSNSSFLPYPSFSHSHQSLPVRPARHSE